MIISQHYIKVCENIGPVGFKPSVFCIQTQIPQARKPQHWKSHHSDSCLGTHWCLTNTEKI